MRDSAKLAVTALVMLSMASCAKTPTSAPSSMSESATAATPAPSPEVVLSPGGKKAVVYSGTPGGQEYRTRLVGELKSDGAGCLTLLAADGDARTLVFPPGTKFRDESVVLPDGSSATEGSQLAVDGAVIPADERMSICLNYARLFSVTATVQNR
jgi:hypothetical protein